MRPLMEMLEDERMLMLKQDTIYQNMLRYNSEEATQVLNTRKRIIDGNLEQIRQEIREYIVELFEGGDKR